MLENEVSSNLLLAGFCQRQQSEHIRKHLRLKHWFTVLRLVGGIYISMKIPLTEENGCLVKRQPFMALWYVVGRLMKDVP